MDSTVRCSGGFIEVCICRVCKQHAGVRAHCRRVRVCGPCAHTSPQQSILGGPHTPRPMMPASTPCLPHGDALARSTSCLLPVPLPVSTGTCPACPRCLACPWVRPPIAEGRILCTSYSLAFRHNPRASVDVFNVFPVHSR